MLYSSPYAWGTPLNKRSTGFLLDLKAYHTVWYAKLIKAIVVTKLSYDDWLRRGLKTLAEDGADALKIDRLCRAMHVTKGSFYHHFRNREEFVQALLAFWQRTFTDEVIAQIAQYPSPEERGQALSRLTTSLQQNEERAIRAWAQWDPVVAKQVDEADKKRLTALEKLLPPLIQVPELAPLVAKLVYAHFLGVQQLRENASMEEWQRMDSLLQALFTDPSVKPLLESYR